MSINFILVAPTAQALRYTRRRFTEVHCPSLQAYCQAGGGLFVFLQCREILSYLWWDGRCSSQLCRKDTEN